MLKELETINKSIFNRGARHIIYKASEVLVDGGLVVKVLGERETGRDYSDLIEYVVFRFKENEIYLEEIYSIYFSNELKEVAIEIFISKDYIDYVEELHEIMNVILKEAVHKKWFINEVVIRLESGNLENIPCYKVAGV